MAEEDVTLDKEAGLRRAESEEHAKRLGWVPKEDFKGDPERWTDADTFLKRGEEILPILQANNRRLQDSLDRNAKETGDLKETLRELVEHNRKANEAAYKRGLADADAKMRRAVETADPAAFEAAKAERDALEPPTPQAKPQEQKPSQQELPPEITDWIGRNEWFNRDPELNGYATGLHGRLLKEKPGLSMTDNLAEVEREVKRRFPEKFENPRRNGASAVTSPSGEGGAPRKRGKTFDDLPPDAKAACMRFEKMIPGYKREEYLANYDWT